jgi:hypothetical protein
MNSSYLIYAHIAHLHTCTLVSFSILLPLFSPFFFSAYMYRPWKVLRHAAWLCWHPWTPFLVCLELAMPCTTAVIKCFTVCAVPLSANHRDPTKFCSKVQMSVEMPWCDFQLSDPWVLCFLFTFTLTAATLSGKKKKSCEYFRNFDGCYCFDLCNGLISIFWEKIDIQYIPRIMGRN